MDPDRLPLTSTEPRAARPERAPGGPLMALAGLAGFGFGFGCFATALWANLRKDGYSGDNALDLLAAFPPLLAALLLAGVIVAVFGIRHDYGDMRGAFAGGAIVTQIVNYRFLIGWLVALAAAESIRRRRLKGPRFDVAALCSGLTLVAVAIVYEGAR